MTKTTVNRIARMSHKQEMQEYHKQFGFRKHDLELPDVFDEFLEEEERREIRRIAKQHS